PTRPSASYDPAPLDALPIYLEIGLLVVATDVVTLADAAVLEDLSDRRAMILHVQPIAYVATLTVDRQGLVDDGVQDHEGNELFGKLVGAVVVRAVDDQRRKPIGVIVRAHQMVRGRLRGCVGAVGRERSRFVERRVVGSERTEYLVGRDVQKSEILALRRLLLFQPNPRFLEQGECPEDIGLDELSGPVNGTIYVAFRGEV